MKLSCVDIVSFDESILSVVIQLERCCLNTEKTVNGLKRSMSTDKRCWIWKNNDCIERATKGKKLKRKCSDTQSRSFGRSPARTRLTSISLTEVDVVYKVTKKKRNENITVQFKSMSQVPANGNLVAKIFMPRIEFSKKGGYVMWCSTSSSFTTLFPTMASNK